MSANVFEQYQKYYESLITRHKSNCQLENQTQFQEAAKQTQPQDPQQPQAQQPLVQPNSQLMPQAMPQNPALPQQHQQQLQYMTPVYVQQQPNWPQTGTDMYSRSSPVQQYNPQRLACLQPPVYYGPDGSGYYYCNDVTYSPQQQQPQSQFPMQPMYAQCCVPETYNYCQFGATFPTLSAAPGTYSVQAQQTAQPTFKPDGPAETAAEAAAAALSPDPMTPAAAAPVYPDATPKKPVFCYPYSVNGFQGGYSCNPCSGCKTTTQPSAATTPAATAAGTPAVPNQPCEGKKDCQSGWSPAVSAELLSTKADKEGDRLPLGVEEPFVVGPTTYQYFFG